MGGRNKERVQQKREDLGISEISDFEGPYDLIVDATPVASDPKFLTNAPGLSHILKESKIVFCHSMPEKDNKTNYLEEYCKGNNIYFIPGKLMYISQLVKQFALYFEDMEITEEEILSAWEAE